MKYLMLLTLVLTGCAHKTIHEICTNADVLGRYRDYAQCYQEEADSRDRRAAIAAAFRYVPPKSTQCRTKPDFMGGYKTVCE